jgi:hypothetical protein
MHMNLQDYLAIVGSILGPILTLMGFMWHHSNTRFDKMEEKVGADIKDVRADIKRVEEKIDAVRDRVSRIEGQLVSVKVISFEEQRPKPTARPSHSKVSQAQ